MDNRLLTDDDEVLYHDISLIATPTFRGLVKTFRIGVMNTADGDGGDAGETYNPNDLIDRMARMRI